MSWSTPGDIGGKAYVHVYAEPQMAERIYCWFKECESCGFAMSAVVRQSDFERVIDDRLPLAVCAWQCDTCGRWQSTKFAGEYRDLLQGMV